MARTRRRGSGVKHQATFDFAGLQHALASGETYYLTSIIKKLNKLLNKTINYQVLPYRGFEVKNCRLNIKKSKNALKFIPQKKLNDVLQTMITKWK